MHKQSIPTSAAERTKIASLYRQGFSQTRIASICDRPRWTVRAVLEREGIQARPSGRPRLHTLNESAFADPSDPDVQYWAGFLMADGCVYRSGYQNSISLNLQASDRDHLQKFRQFVGSSHPISEFQPRPNVCNGRLVFGGMSVRFIFQSRRIADDLARFGVVPRKSYCAKASSLCANSPDFWRGCIDGDGHLGIRQSHVGTYSPVLGLVGTLAIVSQFADFAKLHSPTVKAAPKKNNNSATAHNIQLTGRHATIVAKAIYGRGGASLSRKQEIADRIISREQDFLDRSFRAYIYRGRAYQLFELAAISGYKRDVIAQRIHKRGWSVEMAVETPVRKWGRGAD